MIKDDMNEIYPKCTTERLCFGLPENCVTNKNCKVLASSLKKDTTGAIQFEIASQLDVTAKNTYIALGLSKEVKMYGSVIQCYVDESGVAKMGLSHNEFGPRHTNQVIPGDITGIKFDSMTFTDGLLKCVWTRNAKTTVKGQSYDLINSAYHLQIATGEMNESKNL